MRRHLRRKSDKLKPLRFAVAVFLVIIVGVLIPGVFRSFGAIVMYPIQGIDRWFSESSMVIPTLWRDKIEMQTEIAELEQQVAELSRKDISQRRLFDENNRLRALLNDASATRTLAVVTAKPTELPYDLMKIDRGSKDGIQVGAPVFIGQDSVIGLVSDVYAAHSFVTLFTTPDFVATVFLSGADVTATLEGQGGGVARVKLPQGIPIRMGDLVHIPSIQPGLYGEIAWVVSEPTQPEQYGYITPEIPIASLYQVAVGQPSEISINEYDIAQRVESIKQDALVVSDLVLATTTAISTEVVASTTPES